MELSIDNKISVGKNNKTAILLDDLLTYQMPAEWVKLIRWLQVGTSKDPDRPILHAFHVHGTRIETTDGFRIHMVDFETHEQRLLPEGLFELVSISKRYVAFKVSPDALFPDTNIIFTQMKPLVSSLTHTAKKLEIDLGELLEGVTAFVCVSPDLLASSLKLDNTRGAKITIYNGPFLVDFPTGLGGYDYIGVTSIKAIIMPALNDDGSFAGLAIPS